MKILQLKIDDLKPYANNAKQHPQKQVDLLAKNIKRFGFTTPVLIDEKNNVIAGHGRLMALRQLGETKVPCVRMEGLSEKDIKALRLADNKIAEMGEWDMDLAIGDLKDLDDELLELTGFDKDLLIEADEQDDVIPKNPPPKAKLGDLWLLGEHRVLCGDSTKKEDVERLMDGKKADMVFTDPPYNIGYNGSPDKDWEVIENDSMSNDSFREFLMKSFANYSDAVKRGSGMYVFHSPRTQASFSDAIVANGFEIKQQMIWNKPSQVPGMGDYRSKHEPFYYAVVKGNKAVFYGDRTNTTIWDFQKTDQELLGWARRQKT